MPTTSPTPRRARRTAGVLAVASICFSVIVASSSGAAAGPSSTVTAAKADVERAASVRVAAEARVDELERAQGVLRAQLAARSAESGAIAGQLAEARERAREQAIGAYVAGGDARELIVFLHSDEMAEARARATVLSSQADSAIDAAADFQKLKEENDPRIVALGEQIDAVTAQLGDARSALMQAEAQQADAERRLVEAQAAAEATRRDEAARAATAVTAPAAPAKRTAAGRSAPSAPSVSADDSMAAAWARLRECESGGDYTIVSASGRYRGAYQFSQSTWESVGGTGDPAAASPAEQDYRAQLLYEQRGRRPWPHCGRFLP